jgi:hypothetical protein
VFSWFRGFFLFLRLAVRGRVQGDQNLIWLNGAAKAAYREVVDRDVAAFNRAAAGWGLRPVGASQ